MKRFTYIVIVAVCLISCNRHERIFSQSAAERMADAVDLYSSALSARGTWIMEYFPDDQLRYGGWIYVLDFHEDLTVDAWFEGEKFVPQTDPVTTSEYRVDFSIGPMLKFCTNNDYIHFFSFPGRPDGGGYQGYRGDYEFTIMSLDNAMDNMILRGMKTENRIRLTPLSGEWTPESYIKAVQESQMNVKPLSFDIVLDGEVIGKATRGSRTVLDNFSQYSRSKIWTLEYGDIKEDICTISLPDGVIKTYAPYTFKAGPAEGLEIYSFRWIAAEDSARDRFVCLDNDRIELK